MRKPSGKCCPVCGTHEWKYDVLTMSGAVFCGDCYTEVKGAGDELELRIWSGYDRVFRNTKDFKLAVGVAKEKFELSRPEGICCHGL